MRMYFKIIVWLMAPLLMGSVALGASRTRILQEVVAPDQRLERLHGMPVIVSKKQYSVILTPQSIMLAERTILKFNLLISNPTKTPLTFSLDQIKGHATGTPLPTGTDQNKGHAPQYELKILSPDDIVADERGFYSKEEYGITDEQEDKLTPFVDEQMARLRAKLMKAQTIAPNDKVVGMIAVEVPFGTAQFTLEVITAKEHHKFEFNVGEF